MKAWTGPEHCRRRRCSRTFAAIEEYRGLLAAAGVTRARFVATSATRDASNRDDFVWGVRERLGVEPEVIDGHEEARLSFDGATRESAPRSTRPAETPYLVIDIGGGSTEFVVGNAVPEAARSVDIGCVRLTERHFHHDPPLPAEVAAARDDIDAAIKRRGADRPAASRGDTDRPGGDGHHRGRHRLGPRAVRPGPAAPQPSSPQPMCTAPPRCCCTPTATDAPPSRSCIPAGSTSSWPAR